MGVGPKERVIWGSVPGGRFPPPPDLAEEGIEEEGECHE